MKRVFAKRHRSHSPFRQSDSSDRLPLSFRIRRKHHLHRKTQVLLCELNNAYALLISRSDLQCFSHEDGCLHRKRVAEYACLNCYIKNATAFLMLIMPFQE